MKTQIAEKLKKGPTVSQGVLTLSKSQNMKEAIVANAILNLTNHILVLNAAIWELQKQIDELGSLSGEEENFDEDQSGGSQMV
jgi:hypothetical protein